MLQALISLNNNFKSWRKLFKTEKELQSFVESNITSIFNYIFIDTEYTLTNNLNTKFRFDTLAFNPVDNSIKVIEYKNHKYDWLLEQGVSYLMELENNFLNLKNVIENKLGKTSINKEQSSVDLVTPELTDRQKLIYFHNKNDIYNKLDLFLVESQENKLLFWKTKNIDDFNKIDKFKEFYNLNRIKEDSYFSEKEFKPLKEEEFIAIWFTGKDEQINDKIEKFVYLKNKLNSISSELTLDYWNGLRRHAFIKYRGKTIANFNPFEFKEYSTIVFHIKEFREKIKKKDYFNLIYMKGKDENLRFNIEFLKSIEYIMSLFKIILE